MIITTPVTDYIPASILTTIGDIVRRGAADPERLPMLSACLVHLNGNQTVTTGGDTLIEFETVLIDLGSEFDPTPTNHCFQPNADGYYMFGVLTIYQSLLDGNSSIIKVFKDATTIGTIKSDAPSTISVHTFGLVFDYVLSTEKITFTSYHNKGVDAVLAGLNRYETMAYAIKLPL